MAFPSGRRACCLALLLVLGAPGRAVTVPSEVTMRVNVLDFQSSEGAAGVAVWNAAEGFPEGIEHALDTIYVEIVDGAAATEFGPFPPGVYAVTAYHDKNANKKLDKNWVGMPREAWGVSNAVRPRLRAPRFDEARLDLAAGTHHIEIRVD